MKRCTICGTPKKLSEFSRQANGVYGRKSECKMCQVKANRERRQRDRLARKALSGQCSICGKLLTPEQAESERLRTVRTMNLPRCPDCRYLTDAELLHR